MKSSGFFLLVHLFFLTWNCPGQTTTVTIQDTGFLNCLKSRYAGTLNSKGQLIVAEAAKIQGNLTCQNRNIVSVEGIQYFTGVSSIVLQTNAISYVPDISALKKLKTFNIAENNLDQLPDFSKIPGLQEIYAHRNHIKVLPDLKNDSLTTLYIHSNLLDTLPNLSHLKQLTRLNLTYNNLRYVPNLDKLVSMQIFECWKNQLVELPPLDSLKELNTLNVSYNNLTKGPVLGTKSKLQIVFLNDNNIQALADFSNCTTLQNVRLYNNPLTFRELLSLTSIPGYDTLFKLNPQEAHNVGVSQTIKELDRLLLTTGIDVGVPGISYQWYKNGTLYKIVSNDTLLVPKASFSDSGQYMCQIKHPLFPSVTLFTDNFLVSIAPCISFSNVTISTTDISCLNSGTVLISGDHLSSVASFDLISTLSGKKYTSSIGTFTGLSETSYTLNMKTKTGCEKKYPKWISLNQKECEEVLISPDNDGVSDTYYFPEMGKVIIYDKRGQAVKTLSIPGEWDGSSDKGKVFSGFYVADINNGKKLVGITVLY